MRLERRAGQMSELLKFFAEDFDVRPFGETAEPAMEPVAAAGPDSRELELLAVREAGYQDGLRDGMQQAAAARDAAAARAMAVLEEKLLASDVAAALEADRAATAVARLLVRLVMKLLPAACARHGAGEIAEVARAVLPALHQEPRIVVAVHSELAAAIEIELARLGASVRQRAVLAPDDDVAPGDVRISWRDGSAARDTGELLRRVAEVFASQGLLDAD